MLLDLYLTDVSFVAEYSNYWCLSLAYIQLSHFLLVFLTREKEKQQEKTSNVFLPEGVEVDDSKFKLVNLIRLSASSKFQDLDLNTKLIVPSHMIEKVVVSNKDYYLILENHVMGFFKSEDESRLSKVDYI